MRWVRRQIGMRHGAVAMLLLAALLTRLVAPAGFMPEVAGGGFRIVVCSGYGPVQAMAAMPGMAGMDHGAGHPSAPDHPGKGDMPCGFGGLAMPALAGADPILLALALVFIVAVVPFLAPRLAPRRATRLRPPLRAPPRSA